MSEKYFKKMIELLEAMNSRLERIEMKLSADSTPVSSLDLLSKIPKSHIETYFAVQQLGEATCTEVADITGRSHNLESRYLVRLKELGMLRNKRVPVSDKSKRGTEVKYFIEEGN
ncbi:MAG: hypothetical protein ACXAAM_07400 [Candidatus Heimdallarchaeaceae archaeon]|jgi:predicted transcriptional regulator